MHHYLNKSLNKSKYLSDMKYKIDHFWNLGFVLHNYYYVAYVYIVYLFYCKAQTRVKFIKQKTKRGTNFISQIHNSWQWLMHRTDCICDVWNPLSWGYEWPAGGWCEEGPGNVRPCRISQSLPSAVSIIIPAMRKSIV